MVAEELQRTSITDRVKQEANDCTVIANQVKKEPTVI